MSWAYLRCLNNLQMSTQWNYTNVRSRSVELLKVPGNWTIFSHSLFRPAIVLSAMPHISPRPPTIIYLSYALYIQNGSHRNGLCMLIAVLFHRLSKPTYFRSLSTCTCSLSEFCVFLSALFSSVLQRFTRWFGPLRRQRWRSYPRNSSINAASHRIVRTLSFYYYCRWWFIVLFVELIPLKAKSR